MAGLLVPYEATKLVTALKAGVKLPIQLHTCYTSGVASMTYMKAVEAGCDVIDTAMSPLAMGTSQPATEVMVETFRGTPYDTGLVQGLLSEIAEYFAPYREECKEWIQQDKDVLSYALFPQVATDFFKYRQAQQKGVDVNAADKENKAYPV